jgi:hypothetical protein
MAAEARMIAGPGRNASWRGGRFRVPGRLLPACKGDKCTLRRRCNRLVLERIPFRPRLDRSMKREWSAGTSKNRCRFNPALSRCGANRYRFDKDADRRELRAFRRDLNAYRRDFHA